MAKPIKATPVVKGQSAERIRNEMRSGTPNTDHRVATIRRADKVFATATGASRGGEEAKK